MQLSALCRGGVTVRCEQRMRPPTQAVLFRRENGLSHGLNKVKGTSQPGWLPSPRVPLLHRTKDTPVPTAIPTLAELATIAHTHRCSVVATHHRRVLLDDTASPLPFLGVRFGPAVKAVAARIGPADHRAIVVAVDRSGEAIAYDPTTDRIESDVRRLTALDPARRTLGLATRPCRRPVWALANLVWLDRVLAAALDAPLGEPPHWLELRRLHPLAEAGPQSSPEVLAHHTRHQPTMWAVLRAGSIEGTITWTPIRPALASWFDEGSFARHCFASLPDLDIVVADLHELLGASGWRRVLSGLARP